MKNKKLTVLVFCLLFVGVLGIYYAQPILSHTARPAFEFETTEGNLAELEGIHYRVSIGNNPENDADISLEGTKTASHPLLQSFYVYVSPQLQRWQKKYPNFMRSKTGYYKSNFLEDQEGLYYIEDYARNWNRDGEDTIVLPIEKLDKATKTVSRQELKVESSDSINFISANQITKAGSYLAISLYISGSEDEGDRCYIYNWETGKIVKEIKLNGTDELANESWHTDVVAWSETEPKFVLIQTNYEEELFDEEGSTETGENPSAEPVEENTENNEEITLQIYDPLSDQTEKVELPRGIDLKNGRYFLEEGKIFVIQPEKNAFFISLFDLDKDKITQQEKIAVKEENFAEEPYLQFLAKEDKLLITGSFLESAEDKLGILLVDKKDLKKRFEGSLHMTEKSSRLFQNETVYMDDIYFE